MDMDEDQPKRYRVHLAVHVFAHLEVSAVTPALACRIAEDEAANATRQFITHPHAFRVEQHVRLVPGNPLEWVEVEKS